MEIAIALDTAVAERWFSLMALLKDKRRNRMNKDVLNKLVFVCCHAPKSMLVSKTIVHDIRVIWLEAKDRYKKKWTEWETTVSEMEFDELDINNAYM